MSSLFNGLLRKRSPEGFGSTETKYVRCLSTLDLSALGIASVVGAGLYVVVGKLARDVAGPAVIFSFALAALSSLLSGICYAEFGCRIPTAGSAYVYTYVSLGEMWAFIAGWNMILEYVIAAASIGRACSEYINSITGGVVYHFFATRFGTWQSPFLGSFPDFLALCIVLLIALIIGLGIKYTSVFNKIVISINISVIVFIICIGAYYADISNWSTMKRFAPYGIQGVFSAAASCFYAFVGFDVIGTAGEEAINPKVAIPRALMITIAISFLAYFGVSTVLTMMQPYNQLDKLAPLTEAFVSRGFKAGKYVVACGAIFSTLGALLSVSFGAPRIIHAMAADGLLFKQLDVIHSSTHVPVRALVCSTTIIGILTVILDLEQLVEMLSIGTLIAYTLVAAGVLHTRYQCNIQSVDKGKQNVNWFQTFIRNLQKTEKCQTEDAPKDNQPTDKSSFQAGVITFILSIGLISFCSMISLAFLSFSVLTLILTLISGIIVVVSTIFLWKLPVNSASYPFTVPLVPFLPILTLFINFLLIVNLNSWTFLRFSVWMLVGMLVYGLYGYHHSLMNTQNTS